MLSGGRHHYRQWLVGLGSTVQVNPWVEGPTIMKVNGEWRLCFRRFRVPNGRFGLATSKELVSWTDQTAESFVPRDTSHGTILRVTRSATFKASPQP